MIDFFTNKIIDNIRNEEAKRYSLPKVDLSEIEIEVLRAVAQGRNIKEITTGLKLYNKYYTFYSVSKIILKKLEAFTYPHAVNKAKIMGII